MNNITEHEYWKEIDSLAGDIVAELRDELADDDEEIDASDAYERVQEMVDGHEWIIYCAYNLDVINHSDNPDAWEDLGTDYAGQIIRDQGLDALHAYIACLAMQADLMDKVNELV